MPDALQMLREQHDEVKDIFKKFSSTDDTRVRKDLAQQAMVKLEVHSNLEEEVFYPAVRMEGGTAQLMNEAEEEHHVADLLIDELRRMSPSDDRYEAKFEVLAESVRHHIEEEESEIFPKAAELGQDRLGQLGAEMEKRKPALMQQAEKMMTAKPSGSRARGARGTGRRTTRAATGRTVRATGARRTVGRTTRTTGASGTSRRTTRTGTSRSASGRTTRGSASRTVTGRTTPASTSRSTSARTTRGSTPRSASGRATRAASSRGTATRSTSGRTTRGPSARSSSAGRSSARNAPARTGSARSTRASGTSRGRTAAESRRRTPSRTAGSRGGSPRR